MKTVLFYGVQREKLSVEEILKLREVVEDKTLEELYYDHGDHSVFGLTVSEISDNEYIVSPFKDYQYEIDDIAEEVDIELEGKQIDRVGNLFLINVEE